MSTKKQQAVVSLELKGTHHIIIIVTKTVHKTLPGGLGVGGGGRHLGFKGAQG